MAFEQQRKLDEANYANGTEEEDDDEFYNNISSRAENLKQRARERVKQIVKDRMSVEKLMSENELMLFRLLCKKHKFSLTNFPPLLHIRLSDDDLIRTPNHLWQLWIYDKYINKKYHKNVWMPNVLEGFKEMISQRIFRIGVKEEDRHYSFAIYDFIKRLGEIGITTQLSSRDNKLHVVSNDVLLVHEDSVFNAIVNMYAESEHWTIIDTIHQTGLQYMTGLRKVNEDLRKEKEKRAETNKPIMSTLSSILSIATKERSLVNDWEFQTLNKFYDLLNRDNVLSEKQLAIISKVQDRIKMRLKIEFAYKV